MSLSTAQMPRAGGKDPYSVTHDVEGTAGDKWDGGGPSPAEWPRTPAGYNPYS
jgi:hypothetical protein